uniref:Uncharacterized protein n=1 Tax=Bionectria ochroleuca TaxID=29856 RepID=A0A0B7KEN6_BIOOC
MQAYLVMNRHIHGPPKGLALKSLTKTCWMTSWGDGLMWKHESSAKIIGTDLFLRIVHTVEGKASDVRDAIDEGDHFVCMHVTTDSVDLVHGYTRSMRTDHTVAALRDPQAKERRCGLATLLGQPTIFFQECKDAPGFCPVCLTDYTTTIEQANVTETYWQTVDRWTFFKPTFDGVRVSITAYHQLGSCRNTDDWRWRALADLYVPRHDDIECRSSSLRNLRRYSPGIVKRAWQKQQQRPETRWSWLK